MSTLKAQIESFATEFTTAVLSALRGASLEDIVSLTSERRGPGRPRGSSSSSSSSSSSGSGSSSSSSAPKAKIKGGRLGRRTNEDIARALSQIVGVLSQNPKGLRAEQIRDRLGFDKREMPKPIADGLSSGAIKKSGEKRATIYTLGSSGSTSSGLGVKKKSASKK